jgi:hypothetical protein
MLAQREVVPYLMKRGLVTEQAVVDSDLAVLDVSRRNRNMMVVSERNPSYLLKQGATEDGMATVAHEGEVYRFLGSAPGSDRLLRYLPRSYGYDPEERVLILELLPDAEAMHEYQARRRRFSRSLAGALGDALAALHRLGDPEAMAGTSSRGFTDQRPFAFSIHRPSLTMIRTISSANLQLIKVLQHYAEFRRLLDELCQEWRCDSFIHGDIKWDNCLLCRYPTTGRAARLKIVDWELAGLGDPCWDVGAAFSSYLGFWLFSIPITGEAPPERFLELARFPLERMQPAMRSFWQSYVRRMGLDPASSRSWLLRSVRYSAARLILTAYEHMQMSVLLTGNMICMLQLSLNIMLKPSDAAEHLLGIPVAQ